MIIDLKKLMQSGKTTSEFFFEYSPSAEVVSLPNAEIVPPVKILGKVYVISDKSAEIEAEIAFTLKGECTRCLELTEKQFVTQIEEAFGDGEDMYPVSNGKIDLSKAVDDAIVLAMPIVFLCDEDCKGIELK